MSSGIECCDGTGFADYAAVPCPNPECPVWKSPQPDWCVWMLLPNRSGPAGWSMVHNGVTQREAERAAKTATFRARAATAGKAAGYRPEALKGRLPVDTEGLPEPPELQRPPAGAIRTVELPPDPPAATCPHPTSVHTSDHHWTGAAGSRCACGALGGEPSALEPTPAPVRPQGVKVSMFRTK